MDEKTERLRNLFLEVADEETVTEHQREGPGSLRDDQPIRDRLIPVIQRMRERYTFEYDFDNEIYIRIIEGFINDNSDHELAETLELMEKEVFRSRLDLHLVRSLDWPLSIEMSEYKRRFDSETAIETIAMELDEPTEQISMAHQIIEAMDTARRSNYRFVDEFEEIVADRSLTVQLARDARETGLRDATEDMESDIPY